ncbi:MAG: D-glycero-beta-D-manno-heptose 1-phosphate adenylyltransferase [Candidatus Omnitrophica bacterium]|nr:D-glycero-beta-D-manno-heptose 1-phosphate adenylyltransferase [Candidatus Omnitrophota bacterium]
MRNNPKIKSLAALKKTVQVLRGKKKRIVFTNGCFDLLHRGHIQYLKKARSLGNALIIGLNSDASVRRLKGSDRPATKQADRAEILAGLEFVDYITIFNQDTPLKLIKQIKPDVLVKGADWKKSRVVGKDIVEAYGGRVELIKYLKGYSTTGLLKNISNA